MRITTLVAAALAAIVVGTGASSALAAERPSLADDIAARLGVSGADLRAAVKATLVARIDAAVAAGRLTPEQASKLKTRIEKANGLGLGARRAFAEKHKEFAKRLKSQARDRGPAAEYLGLTRAELRAELRKGQSLAQIARAKGKSVDGLVAALTAHVKARLTKAVESDRLTRQRADELLDRLTDRIEKLVQKQFAARQR